MFIDTHSHLFYPNFNGELDEVIQSAAKVGVEKIIVPATDLASCAQVIQLVEKYPQVYGTVGIHPHDSREWNDAIIGELENLTKHPKIVAIGEIGLDYYYDFSPKEKQMEALHAQIKLALKLDLPVVIHNRDADEDILSIMNQYSKQGLRGQLHCFNSSIKHALEFIKMGFFISFTGNITFKKADHLREVAASVSLEHLLLETDSPFMTPVPFRGKRNDPSNIPLIAQMLSELHNVSVEDIARITSYNVFKLFGIGSKPKTSFTYQIGNSLYINVTNRCNADCFFCDHKGDAVISGYNLKMSKNEEPNAGLYINEIGDPLKYKEIVFCGYGEPTIRWDVVKEIAVYVKNNGGRTRLNTNGHGSFINKRNITPEMKDLIDTVSISLNAVNKERYAEIMKVQPELFNEMLNFAVESRKYANNVILSIVDIEEDKLEDAKKLVTELGLEFRARHYF
ncbi:MAG: YchF/TatD family DNA exonuclease [Ignavibacteria bacterium]|nr:YchF/TatD family DNA exonuclease [Ignavibacteria bacterium]